MSNILIVDDEESICWGLSRLLGDEGHAVSVASSAEEALEKVPAARPDSGRPRRAAARAWMAYRR